MTDLEDRLRDAFAAVDRQTVAPPLRVDRQARRPQTRWLVAAALAALALVGALRVVPGDDQDVVATDPTPAEFDTVAGTICGRVLREWHSTDPLFATSEAYLLGARARIGLLDSALASFALLPNAPDDSRLRGRVLALLDEARSRAEEVERHAEVDDLVGAGATWPKVDQYIALALGRLEGHGAEGCRP